MGMTKHLKKTMKYKKRTSFAGCVYIIIMEDLRITEISII